jgi:hypothetical protein
LAAGLDSGLICPVKADSIQRAAGRLEDRDAQDQVIRLGLSVSPTAASPKVTDAVDAMAAKLDPDQLTGAHRKAYSERRVTLTKREAAMAELRIYGALDQLAPIHDLLTRHARARAHNAPKEDKRNLDQHRHDLLIGLLNYALPPTGPDQPAPAESGISRAMRAHILVVVNASTLLGMDDDAARLMGTGPIPAEIARRIATDATWQALSADPLTGRLAGLGDSSLQPGAVFETAHRPENERGPWDRPRGWRAEAIANAAYKPATAVKQTVSVRDQTCRNPICGRPAARCELDHIEPFTSRRPAEEQTTAMNLQLLCKSHHELKTHSGWEYSRDPETGQTTVVTALGFTRRMEPETVRP